ncbi:MAG: hypothetical protein WCK93_08740 [Nitrosomonadales bacterium]
MNYLSLINEVRKHISAGDKAYTHLWMISLSNAIKEVAGTEQEAQFLSLKKELEDLNLPFIQPLPYGSTAK